MSSLTDVDLGRCCEHLLGVAAPNGIRAKLLSLGDFFNQDAEGPTEGLFWHKQFLKVKTADEDMLKDRWAPWSTGPGFWLGGPCGDPRAKGVVYVMGSCVDDDYHGTEIARLRADASVR